MDVDLEREYSPSSCVGGNYQPFIAEYRTRSERARSLGPADGVVWHSLRYGPRSANRIELCVPLVENSALAPVVVFIHGGYWQELSAADSLFAAEQFAARGIALAAVDYTLAPRATVEEIVHECRTAVGWLAEVGADHGIDPARMIVAGSSAGAHLGAMVALGPSCPSLAGLVLLSGVYWLEPLVQTTINNALGLDAEAARALSPGLLSDPAGIGSSWPRTVVAWGEIETGSFKVQSRDYAGMLAGMSRNGRASVSVLEVAGRNHFDVVFDLSDVQTPLGAAVADLLDRS